MKIFVSQDHLRAVEAFFYESFEQRGELGASVSIWQDGREVLSLASGFKDRQKSEPWTSETPVLVWSATKGPAAACVLHALEREGESLETPVCAFWPEFKQSGKQAVTFGDVLAHRAGLAVLDEAASVLDHAAAAEALAKQALAWPLGDGHGYHPRSFGPLLDELVRRIAEMPLGDYWRKFFAVPLGLDFWIGLPPERLDSVAPVYPPKVAAPKLGTVATPAESAPFYKALADKTTLTGRAFQSPRGLDSVAAMNTAEARLASLPAFGGIGTARALAKFYAMLANGGVMDGVRFFHSLEPMTTTRSSGHDRVLLRETAFSAGFMRDPVDTDHRKIRQLFGPSLTAFGQPGAGGNHAFADPENGIAFAYAMNQMEPGVLPNERAMGLIRALYSGA